MGQTTNTGTPGRTIASNGYVLVRVGKEHHLADVRGYAYEHRLVAEKKIGRRLLPNELVHHRNEIKTDNQPDNLEVVTGNAEHFAKHRRRDNGLRLPGEANPDVACGCGCGATFPRFDGGGRPRRFVPGHNPPPISFPGDVLEYLKIVPLPSNSRFIAEFFGVDRKKVTAALSKLKSEGKAYDKHRQWFAARQES